MINHFRTLLLNRSGEEAGVSAHLGDEYVPTWYRAVPLPSYLTSVRRLLFGAAPDRVYLNYRVRQCLSLMHSSELAEFVTHLDSRITYDVADDTWLRSDAFGLRASREDVFRARRPAARRQQPVRQPLAGHGRRRLERADQQAGGPRQRTDGRLRDDQRHQQRAAPPRLAGRLPVPVVRAARRIVPDRRVRPSRAFVGRASRRRRTREPHI